MLEEIWRIELIEEEVRCHGEGYVAARNPG